VNFSVPPKVFNGVLRTGDILKKLLILKKPSQLLKEQNHDQYDQTYARTNDQKYKAAFDLANDRENETSLFNTKTGILECPMFPDAKSAARKSFHDGTYETQNDHSKVSDQNKIADFMEK